MLSYNGKVVAIKSLCYNNKPFILEDGREIFGYKVSLSDGEEILVADYWGDKFAENFVFGTPVSATYSYTLDKKLGFYVLKLKTLSICK